MDVSSTDKKELAVAYKEATELNDFETPYAPTVVPPMQWSIEKYKVAELLAYSGKTKKAIAKELSLPLSIIQKWCDNAEFMEAVHKMVEERVQYMKNTRIHILNKILQARIEQAEVEGYADASRKDTVDIITELRKETGEDLNRDSNYARLLEKLVLHQPSVINIGGQ